MALTFTVVLLCSGVAIDYLRWTQARATTSAAIDAAVLAGGLSLQIDPLNVQAALDTARRTYAANVSQRLPVATDTVMFSAADNNQAIQASGHAEISTTVLSVFGVSNLGLISASGAELPRAEVTAGGPGGSNLEVALMLDVTGSMCDDAAGPCTSGAKISALKTAATNLVNIVVRPDQSQHTTKVALVPFSTRVRLAPDDSANALMKTLTNLDSPRSYYYNNCTSSTGSGGSEDSGNWTCNNWVATPATNWHVMPCVTERFVNNTGTFDVSDDAPGPGKWLNGHDGGRMPQSWDSSDDAPASGKGESAADVAADWNYDSSAGQCADIYPGSEIVPLSSDKVNLLNHINSLQAYGGTAGALAASWSWYMLSPNWGGVWTGSSLPAPYSELSTKNSSGAPTLRKVAVMMTDGGFNVLRGQKGLDQQTVSNNALAVCNAMKAKGIEVYTVGFMLNSLSAGEATIARATLGACGNDIKHFYDSLTVGDLEVAFHQIGFKLSGLHLTQ